ncbi:MAG: hypothetical protein LBL04_15835 [Bacteroidales bacterium]|jgi:hypothetical protein|nr:hypothetical protein [Bacteroidales bacterium]
MKNWNEEEDLGGIEGVVLTDVLSEIMAALVGGYSILCVYEEKNINLNDARLLQWKNRREEIGYIRDHFKGDKSYKDMRRWIGTYSKELKTVNDLRKKYQNVS